MGAIPTIGIFRLCLTTRPRSKGWVLTLRLGLSHRSNRACSEVSSGHGSTE